ncbi:Modifier of mdg4 [Operophtera brumata]|uniref:Modifier of mdg4 n=1 Tax=Operophtera brumata TaxID=104452 RepID=A0A0L7KVP4_OPEBR|nr:Modifier of mdg4 [Operophtera brumata]
MGNPLIVASGYKFQITFTTSRRGYPIIVVSGYRFRKVTSNAFKVYWKCSANLNHGCRAVIHTLQDKTIIKCHNVHNH